ncbi:MAG TPA: hypothetical protein DCM40_17160 [Maribacter sp.]|nr:hypothetical protein [Maribacter sp.]|tara:strand:- start:1155 stop:1472 length:318 start_codon:yes stop_codon:yes gene_type:complete
MKLLLENWNSFLNEAHGLSQQDLDYLKNFTEKTNDVEIKRILNFIIKSNVLVDKTQDVTKMKKKNEPEELEEKCQKGYKTHETRKTKKMFGKTYRNCVKAEGKEE